MNLSPSTRNAGLYLLGCAGIIVELGSYVVAGVKPDPTLTILLGGLVGAPSVLNKDEKDPE